VQSQPEQDIPSELAIGALYEDENAEYCPIWHVGSSINIKPNALGTEIAQQNTNILKK